VSTDSIVSTIVVTVRGSSSDKSRQTREKASARMMR
jgi:hypothetical protein